MPQNFDLDRVLGILTRTVELNPLDALRRAIQPSPKAVKSGARVALGFDTNAIFRVAKGKKGADIVDFLAARFGGPIILPGQVIQEVWNNQLSGISPVGKSLKQKFDDLENEVSKIDERFGEEGEAVQHAVSNLLSLHTRTFDREATDAFSGLIDVFISKADVPFVPRLSFHELGLVRRATKTPPGFRDVALGDFFVWADFLYGLVRAGSTEPLDGVAFVTMDQKPDWSRNGVPHPILVAEAELAADAPFQLWSIDDLYAFVDAAPAV